MQVNGHKHMTSYPHIYINHNVATWAKFRVRFAENTQIDCSIDNSSQERGAKHFYIGLMPLVLSLSLMETSVKLNRFSSIEDYVRKKV